MRNQSSALAIRSWSNNGELCAGILQLKLLKNETDDHTYVVEDEDGKRYRNRKFLKPNPLPLCDETAAEQFPSEMGPMLRPILRCSERKCVKKKTTVVSSLIPAL